MMFEAQRTITLKKGILRDTYCKIIAGDKIVDWIDSVISKYQYRGDIGKLRKRIKVKIIIES